MTERVIVRQNNRFETEFLSIDPHQQESAEFKSVEHIHQLTPHGLLLASLGGCTAILLHTYAQNHGLNLREVELRLTYSESFKENPEEIDRYLEQIEEEILLPSELAENERNKLLMIAKQCSIHTMIEEGIHIESRLAEPEPVQK
jgi:putative redox protein